MNKKNKNGFISSIKFLFNILIILMHEWIPSTFSVYMFEGAYIYVDFFFILQGYYLNKKYEDTPYNNSINYLKNRIKRFMPITLISSIFLLILKSIYSNTGKKELFLDAIIQGSLGSNLFVFTISRASFLWFLSASIIVGTVLLYLFCKYKEGTLILGPIIAFGIYNAMYLNIGNLDMWSQNAILGGGIVIPWSILRASADILVGLVTKEIQLTLDKKLMFNPVINSIICNSLVMCSIYVITYHPHSKNDFYLIFVFVTMILLSKNTLTNNRLTDYLDKLCLPMYVFQMPINYLVAHYIQSSYLGGIILITLDLLTSISWIYIIDNIKRRKKTC